MVFRITGVRPKLSQQDFFPFLLFLCSGQNDLDKIQYCLSSYLCIQKSNYKLSEVNWLIILYYKIAQFVGNAVRIYTSGHTGAAQRAPAR